MDGLQPISSDPDHIDSFKPVLLRDAQVPNLIRLPLPNEHTSLMPRIFLTDDETNTVASDRGGVGVHHEHPLILHQHHDDGVARRVCNACVQLISPTDGPFYSCCDNKNNNNELAGPCRDFFLHRCCAHLPATFLTTSDKKYTLTDATTNPFNLFRCLHCDRRCNGFAYKTKIPDNIFDDGDQNAYLDVVCALMSSALITHDAHAQSHILQPLSDLHQNNNKCRCCRETIMIWSRPGYGCTNCHNFNIHAKCALLPNTVNHKFDRHLLKLITTTLDDQREEKEEEEEDMFCEICEKDVDRKVWYYYCDKCDQSFHAACIPCLDGLSKIKFGFSVRVEGHDCALTCIRALTVAGYSCSHCGQTIDGELEDVAFECSECYFRIHEKCAEKLHLPDGQQIISFGAN